MVKVVYADPKPKPPSRGQRQGGVGLKRLRDENGAVIVLRTVDAGSATLSEDITEVFAKNVAKARRENRKLLGTSEYAPKR
jgi:glutamate mutase epsilon subunit